MTGPMARSARRLASNFELSSAGGSFWVDAGIVEGAGQRSQGPAQVAQVPHQAARGLVEAFSVVMGKADLFEREQQQPMFSLGALARFHELETAFLKFLLGSRGY